MAEDNLRDDAAATQAKDAAKKLTSGLNDINLILLGLANGRMSGLEDVKKAYELARYFVANGQPKIAAKLVHAIRLELLELIWSQGYFIKLAQQLKDRYRATGVPALKPVVRSDSGGFRVNRRSFVNLSERNYYIVVEQLTALNNISADTSLAELRKLLSFNDPAPKFFVNGETVSYGVSKQISIGELPPSNIRLLVARGSSLK